MRFLCRLGIHKDKRIHTGSISWQKGAREAFLGSGNVFECTKCNRLRAKLTGSYCYVKANSRNATETTQPRIP